MAEEKTILDALRERIREDYKQRLPDLAMATGVEINAIRRILRPGYSPTLRNVEPLLKHLGFAFVDTRKRGGKTVN